ncbi:nocturnin-like [Plakobranchus ocellatus]|uniref:Nocturnin n=1 Tax=Plakobranchus ocellatus TaxID=259542 RepID=A0AAV3Z8V6_9GAST|nr:nocturnin-like [Plakobranchus ocellatus]
MSMAPKWSELLSVVRERSKSLNPTPLLLRNFTDIHQSSDGTSSHAQAPDTVPNSDGLIRIMQWNLLAQGLCQTSDGFILCPDEALDWEFRQHHILEEFLTYQASVYCLQEVDHFDYLKANLSPLGFDGVFYPKPDSPCLYEVNNSGPDGCAIFWDNSQLRLMSQDSFILCRQNGQKTNQVAISCRFQVISSGPDKGREFVCATTHLKAKKHHAELRTQQGQDLERQLRQKAGDLPLVLCGDFNADPDETVVKGMKKSNLNLLSSYTLLSTSGDEPSFTTWKVRGGKKGQEEAAHTIDYLFYSKDKFQCIRVLKMPHPDQLRPNFLPSYAYPSDHLSLVADLKLIV